MRSIGKKVDLSAFGADFANWVHVFCRSAGRKMDYLINDKVVYTAALPTRNVSIVGIIYGFQGTGAVKNVTLRSRNKLLFQAF